MCAVLPAPVRVASQQEDSTGKPLYLNQVKPSRLLWKDPTFVRRATDSHSDHSSMPQEPPRDSKPHAREQERLRIVVGCRCQSLGGWPPRVSQLSASAARQSVGRRVL